MRWVACLVLGGLVTTGGACSSDSSTASESGGVAGTGAVQPATGGSAGEEAQGAGGSGGSSDVGGTAGTGGADAGTGGTTGGAGGTSGSGGTGGTSGSGGTTGGSGVGGNSTGGVGGQSTGGNGGDAIGGHGGGPSGGAETGGGETGGVEMGGAVAGGAGTGGIETGGAETGGTEAGGAGPCDDPGTLHSGGTQYCENGSVDLGNGYVADIWTNAPGSGCATVFGDEATFKAEWTGPGDFFARAGLDYDGTQPPDQIGTFSADFAITGSGSGLAYIGLHGWMVDPMVDFYILEDWVNDPDGSPPVVGSSRGTIAVDGGTYTVYHSHVGDSSVLRYETYSIRTEPRQCGHISISEHFAEWASLELQMGALASAKFYVEGIQGTGSYELTRATLTVQ